MRTVRFGQRKSDVRLTVRSNWAAGVLRRAQIGLDRQYLLCYIAICIKARRTAGPVFPPQAESTTQIRIPILEDCADVLANYRLGIV
jgi:hypothetical protein